MKSRRQERAIQNYLDHLLSDDQEPNAVLAETVPALPKVIGSSIAKLLDGIEQRTEEVTQRPVAAVTAKPAPIDTAPVVTALAPQPIEPEPLANVVSAATTIDEAIKQFRQQLPDRFQAIVFRVDDLKLALPLHLLGGIQKREKTITPLPAKPSWFMGLLQHEPDNVQVVNTGRYLLGKRYQEDMSDYEFIVVIGNTNWGLACHEIFTTIELTNDDIRWFAAADRRPWLAGMLREQMCALLNSDALTLMLKQSLKKAA